MRNRLFYDDSISIAASSVAYTDGFSADGCTKLVVGVNEYLIPATNISASVEASVDGGSNWFAASTANVWEFVRLKLNNPNAQAAQVRVAVSGVDV